MTIDTSAVFLDYLTVTNRPDNTCAQDVKNYLLSKGAFLDDDHKGRTSLYLSPLSNARARIQLRESKNFVSISATGTALAYLRSHDLFESYLNILSEVPLNVTRLDAALDDYVDAPPVLRNIYGSYPSGFANITRKSVPLSRITKRRGDGEETGSIYFGQRGKNRVIARVYDKQWEQLCLQDTITPPCIRYEIEFARGSNTSLKDASDPYSLFWNHAHVFRLPVPVGLPPWVGAGEFTRYEPMPRVELLPLEVLKRRIERSKDIDAIIHMADQLGTHGDTTLIRLLTERVNSSTTTADKE